jgi:hypothetical protein
MCSEKSEAVLPPLGNLAAYTTQKSFISLGEYSEIFLYLTVLLGPPSMTQNHFLLKILFLGRSGVTEHHRNKNENLIL